MVNSVLGLNERLKKVKSYLLADKTIIHCNLSSVNRQNKKNIKIFFFSENL